MERNIEVFRAHRAISWLYLVLVVAFIGLYFLAPEASLGSIWVPLLLFTALYAAHHVTARGARQGKAWARTSSIVISVFLLLGFPVGTLIGVYLLSNTWRPWDRQPQPSAAGAA